MEAKPRVIEVTVEPPKAPGIPFGLAQALVRVAEDRAAARQADIERECAEKLAAAWAAGFKEGIHELHLAAEKLRASENLVFEQMKPQLLRLVFSLAEEVLGEALSAQPESVSRRLEASMKSFQNETSVKLQLHPEDLKLLSQAGGILSEEKSFSFVANENMPRGALRVTSATGSWDLNPADHLERLKRHIISNRLTDCVLQLPPSEIPNGNESRA